MLVAALACRDPTHSRINGALVLVGLSTDTVCTLQDGAARQLARPLGVSGEAGRRYVIPDRSDRDIKTYDGGCRRAGTFGEAGSGPGEFISLVSAVAYHDSIVALDFLPSLLTVFAPDGQVARSLPLPPRPKTMDLGVLDDSLFLLIGSPLGSADRPLLTIIRPDGSVKARCFNRSAYFGDNPVLIQNTAVMADGAAGVIFASLTGSDSIFAFDSDCNPLARGALQDGEGRPLRTLRALISANQGSLQRPDGGWLHDGLPMLASLIALQDGRVVTQVSHFDARVGVDLLEGGAVSVSQVVGDSIWLAGSAEFRAGVMGRSSDGSVTMLGYPDSTATHTLLLRLKVTPRAPTTATISARHREQP